LIWGRVKSQTLLYLYFTGQEANPTEGRPYRLEEKRALVLDVNFGRDLGAAIAARVVSLGLRWQACRITIYKNKGLRRIDTSG
jgi:hypothetical protein